MLTAFYLTIAVLLNDGSMPPTISYSFPTLDACHEAGTEVVKELNADTMVAQAILSCDERDFDATISPHQPSAAPMPHRHVPGPNEA